MSLTMPKVGDLSWDSRKICFAFPWYKQTNPATAFSVMANHDRQRMAVLLQFGDAFVSHTRNLIACHFLKTSAEWLLTVDDDMILPCGNARWFNDYTGFNFPEEFAGLSTVDRLLSHGKTLIGALYFGRWKNGAPVFAEGKGAIEEARARSGPHDEIRPTKWVGTGCMLIHRSVFLDIEKKFPHLARNENGDFGHFFTSSEHDMHNAVKQALTILYDTESDAKTIAKARTLLEDAKFLSEVNSSLGMGEDVQFCTRALQAGHQPYVDFGLVCGHQGSFVYGPKKAGWVR